jgi:hypothetical protein
MSLEDAVRKALEAIGRKAPEEDLRALRKELEDDLAVLESQNESYRETQKFLESRGVRHIRELSREQRKELTQHLVDTLQKIQQQWN